MLGFICLIFPHPTALVHHHAPGTYTRNITERLGRAIREIKYIKITLNSRDISAGFTIIRITKYLIFAFERKSHLHNESPHHPDCLRPNNTFLKQTHGGLNGFFQNEKYIWRVNIFLVCTCEGLWNGRRVFLCLQIDFSSMNTRFHKENTWEEISVMNSQNIY